MGILRTDHFYDGWQKYKNTDKLADRITKKMVKLIEEGEKAQFYIQGCTYYFIPLASDQFGFGSGALEFTLKKDNTYDVIKQKVQRYLDNSCTGDIYYGGCDTDKKVTKNMSVRWA